MRYARSPPNRLVWLVVGGVGLLASCLRERGPMQGRTQRACYEPTSSAHRFPAPCGRVCVISLSRVICGPLLMRGKKAPDGITKGNSDEARCMCATQNGNADARGKYKATNALRRLRACACSRAPLLMEEIKATHAHRFSKITALVGATSLKCAHGVASLVMRVHVANLRVVAACFRRSCLYLFHRGLPFNHRNPSHTRPATHELLRRNASRGVDFPV